MKEYFQNIEIQPIPHLSKNGVSTDVLRIDQLHPVVSGNKWFKLQHYLQHAKNTGAEAIATFGGSWSNHIIATAYACREINMHSIGYIRGENSTKLTPTLAYAKTIGMELIFTDRDHYRDKQALIRENTREMVYWIMEGGYGKMGAEGAADILSVAGTGSYSHILCAVGTGTMMAGLVKGSAPGQHVVGISVLKNHFLLHSEVDNLLTPEERLKQKSILHDYHFGGYARYNDELISFISGLWNQCNLPTDIVYTSKLLFGVADLIGKGYFTPGSRLLVIHSGGLQGNNSLITGRLPF